MLLAVQGHTGAAAENEDTAKASPAIMVTLKDELSGGKCASPGEASALSAAIIYENCVKDRAYTVTLRLENSTDGGVCTFADGTGTVSCSFLAEASAGRVETELKINTALYEGKTLTAVAWLEGYGDISEREESARIYVPRLNAEAAGETGEKTVLCGKNTAIYDVLSYSGLAPDTEYRIITGLVDGESGEEIRDGSGNAVTATAKFTPKESSGQTVTKISGDLRELTGKEILVYEKLYCVPKNGIPVLLYSTENLPANSRTVTLRPCSLELADLLYAVPVEGATVEIEDLSDGYTVTAVSGSDGVCSFPADFNGEYTCTVLSVPEGYSDENAIYYFSVDSAGNLSPGAVIRIMKKNVIVITKTDASTGEGIQGIILRVRDSLGNELAKLVTNDEGRAYFDANEERDLYPEEKLTFFFSELSVPAEYYPLEEDAVISLNADGSIEGQTEFKMITRGVVTITLTDPQGQPLAGGEIELYYSDGTLQGRAETDLDGHIYFKAPKTGRYTIVETGAPEGYKGTLEQAVFYIDASGAVTGTTVIINRESGDYLSESGARLEIMSLAAAVALLAAAALAAKKIRRHIGKDAE